MKDARFRLERPLDSASTLPDRKPKGSRKPSPTEDDILRRYHRLSKGAKKVLFDCRYSDLPRLWVHVLRDPDCQDVGALLSVLGHLAAIAPGKLAAKAREGKVSSARCGELFTKVREAISEFELTLRELAAESGVRILRFQ